MPGGEQINTTQVEVLVKVIPGAKKNEISALMPDGRLKVRLTAPPVDGKANQALIKLFAKVLDVPKSRVFIISGELSRSKKLVIEGIDRQQYQAIISRLLE